MRPIVLVDKMQSTARSCPFGSTLKLFIILFLCALHSNLCEARPQYAEHEKIAAGKKCGYEVSDKKCEEYKCLYVCKSIFIYFV